MKNVLYFFSVLFLLSLISCKQEIEYQLKTKPLQLTIHTMYDSEMVKDVLFELEEKDVNLIKNKARKEFLKAIDLFKNKNKTVESITLFRKSILLCPDAKAYYELGNALLATNVQKSMNEAQQAFSVAQDLHFEPANQLHFNIAKTIELTANNATTDYISHETLSNLEKYLAFNLSDTSKINQEPAFIKIRNTAEFKKMLKNSLLVVAKNEPTSIFDIYKKSYQKKSTDFEINKEEVSMSKYRESISYDFATFIPEMENTSFGRSVSNDFYYVCNLQETTKFSAFIYSSISFDGNYLQPVQTILVTYSPKGEIISRLLFSCECSPTKIKTGKINGNKITITEYNRIWEKPFTEIEISKNVIKELIELKTAVLEINENGEIIPKNVPADFNPILAKE